MTLRFHRASAVPSERRWPSVHGAEQGATALRRRSGRHSRRPHGDRGGRGLWREPTERARLVARYEQGCLPALAERSHRPRSSPLQMPAAVESRVLELRRQHSSWGQVTLRHRLEEKGVMPPPSLSAIYRALRWRAPSGSCRPGWSISEEFS
ncbi:MAG: helix-turn-helix domain-containing protein [Acidimicrobiales bacterium]|nr:helix-turn-helix domain-containing protein [Acidimicrobiales bacterium]